MNIKTLILRSVAPVAFAAMSLHALGCIAGPSESGLTEEDFLGHAQLGIAGDPGTTNHYDIGCFLDHATQQWLRDASADALVDQTGTITSTSLLATAIPRYLNIDCRQQMVELLVGCAFDSTQSAHYSPVSTSVVTVSGELGYAPQWMYAGLTTDEKELVTACMLQRLNPQNFPIPVLLERPSQPNATTDYPLHESEAWGNLFDSTNPLNPSHDPNLPNLPLAVPFNIFSCDGGDQPSICIEEIYSDGSFSPPIPWTTGLTDMRTCYFNFNDCLWRQMGECATACAGKEKSYSSCAAWDNRLRSRIRNDGSACGIPLY